MEKFDTMTGVAAPFPIVNCDTDKIIPARFLKTLTRTGLGKSLFDAMRYDPKSGEENPDFVLNK
ncbi:MAG: 3-isopropylmalate dehydratase small subunit, partial [Alphaproteobacteria bacterium]